MLTKERMAESVELIAKYLVKQHDDGDINSLYVRFHEITNSYEELTDTIKTWEIFVNALTREE